MMNGFKVYKHILFDADNTLLDFTKAEKTAFEQTFHTLGIALDADIYNLYVEINHKLWQSYEAGEIESTDIPARRFRELYRTAGISSDSAAASKTYQALLGEQTWLEPYAREICEYWSKKACVSIITNGFRETQRKRIMESEIWPFISHLLISEELGVSKPDSAFFSKTLEILHCTSPQDVLIVGDSLSSDILGAMNAGIDCCWYNPGKIALPAQYSINYEIEKLEQLER